MERGNCYPPNPILQVLDACINNLRAQTKYALWPFSMKSIASVNKWIDNSNKEVKSRKKKPSAGTHNK